ncbi:hypothetical protein MMC12_004482 [Toensbergia leucococca]|nr:hypothetical protein [Toensbergia leucococca]
MSMYARTYGVPAGRPQISPHSIEYEYKVIKTLDEGANSERGVGGLNEGVYLVKKRVNGRLYVQKNIPGNNASLAREIHILHALKHPNIITFADAFITKNTIPPRLSLYMEYCDLGSLQSLIDTYHAHNTRNPLRPAVYLPESFIWHTFLSLTSALQYIHHGIPHSKPSTPLPSSAWPLILHRDIKPDNIFLRSVSTQPSRLSRLTRRFFPRSNTLPRNPLPFPRVILADFGCAINHDDPDFDVIDQFVGSYEWMPPELPETSARGDVWAVGAVILSLCRLLPNGPVVPAPAELGDDEKEMWYQSRESRKGVRDLGVGGRYSGELGELVRSCLRFSRANRPLSWKLMGMVREGEEKARARGRWEKGGGVLPEWVWRKR